MFWSNSIFILEVRIAKFSINLSISGSLLVLERKGASLGNLSINSCLAFASSSISL